MCVKKYYYRRIISIMEAMHYGSIWVVFVSYIFGSDTIYKFKMHTFKSQELCLYSFVSSFNI